MNGAKVLLGNIDYKQHTTNEGDQFQEGLRSAGWIISGPGYDGERDIVRILNRYKPEMIVVHDKRDWDPASNISFRKDIGFKNLRTLSLFKGKKFVVVKDAATFLDYQRQFYDEVKAAAAIVYYHPESVASNNEWLKSKPMIRTYHTIDRVVCEGIHLQSRRKRCLVSGARGKCYPLREMAMRYAGHLRTQVIHHPGYGNKGSNTDTYLKKLAEFRVHIATASQFGFALRKIIESVAMATTPVTNLPEYDVLPEIDEALIRVKTNINRIHLHHAINKAFSGWNMGHRLAWAKRAWEFYDYRAMGKRLDDLLVRF